MPDYDPQAAAALDETTVAPAWFIWIDFVGDPLRATTFGKSVTFAGTGDADLDGETFVAFDGRWLDVGDVSNSDGGSDTLTTDLSGLPAIDDELLAQIADKSLWYGRTVRIWQLLHDETGTTAQGAVVHWSTGYASRALVIPGKESQTIRLEVENYLAAFNQASNRSYLNQKDYDPDDNSPQATLAAANMGRGVGRSSHSRGSVSNPRFEGIGL